jgi:hypothetical protein
MTVTYFDIDDNEMSCTVNADDEACAIGVVLDELGEDIALASPFAVWRDRTPKSMGRKGDKGKLISGPVPHVDEDEPIPTQKLSAESEAKPSAEATKLLAEVATKAGAELQR